MPDRDCIHVHSKREGHVVADHLEAFMTNQVLDVVARPAKEVVDANNIAPLAQQPFAEM